MKRAVFFTMMRSKEILKADFVFRYAMKDVNLLYWNKRIAAMKKGKKDGTI